MYVLYRSFRGYLQKYYHLLNCIQLFILMAYNIFCEDIFFIKLFFSVVFVISMLLFSFQYNLDTSFDAGGSVSIGLTATTIVSQWTWAATLLQSSTVASKVSRPIIKVSIIKSKWCSNQYSMNNSSCIGWLMVSTRISTQTCADTRGRSQNTLILYKSTRVTSRMHRMYRMYTSRMYT